jgi:hypothetical protein
LELLDTFGRNLSEVAKEEDNMRPSSSFPMVVTEFFIPKDLYIWFEDGGEPFDPFGRL